MTRFARTGTSKRGIFILTLLGLCYSVAAGTEGGSKSTSAIGEFGSVVCAHQRWAAAQYPIQRYVCDSDGGRIDRVFHVGSSWWTWRRRPLGCLGARALTHPGETPGNLAVLNSPFNDSLSVFNTSGNIMYFHSTRP